MSAFPGLVPAVESADREGLDLMTWSYHVAARLDASLRATGRSQSEVARAISVSPTVISQFIGHRYEGRTVELAKKVADFLDLEARREAARGEPQFVETRIAKECLTVLAFCHEHRVIGAIVGEPGIGKSRAALHYVERHPGTAFMISLTVSTRGAKGFYEEILETLRLPSWGTLRMMERRLIAHLRGSGRLIIIDEAHHLNDLALGSVQAIHDRTGCGLVLIGNPTVLDHIYGRTSRARFPQLASRIAMPHTLQEMLEIKDVEMVVKGVLGAASPEVINFLWGKAHGLGGLRVAVHLARLAQAMAKGENRGVAIQDLERAAMFLGNVVAA